MSTDVVMSPLAPLDTTATANAMEKYQEGLKSLMKESDWQTFIDKKGDSHAFLKKTGWRKIGLWFGLNFELITKEIDRDERGTPKRARVVYRAHAQNGRWSDGEGGCDVYEKNIQKPENDLLGTAATRALNRAISNLVGLGEVSAEEVTEGTGTDGDTPAPYPPGFDSDHPWGPSADKELRSEAAIALENIFAEEDDFEGELLISALESTFGDFPEIAARTIKGVAWFMDRDEAYRAKEGSVRAQEGVDEPPVPMTPELDVDEVIAAAEEGDTIDDAVIRAEEKHSGTGNFVEDDSDTEGTAEPVSPPRRRTTRATQKATTRATTTRQRRK